MDLCLKKRNRLHKIIYLHGNQDSRNKFMHSGGSGLQGFLTYILDDYIIGSDDINSQYKIPSLMLYLEDFTA